MLYSIRSISLNLNKTFGGIKNESSNLVTGNVSFGCRPDGIVLSLHGSL
jgi:hypothetical protein